MVIQVSDFIRRLIISIFFYHDGLIATYEVFKIAAINDAFVVALKMIIIDEDFDFYFQAFRTKVVFSQDVVLLHLLPTFKPALCMKEKRWATKIAHPVA